MRKIIPAAAAVLMTVSVLLFTGCAAGRPDAGTLYDLGPLGTRGSQNDARPLPALPPISIAEIHVPAWLDGTMMYFRLNYANSQQPRPYAQARWTMAPAQLLLHHLKSRIAHAGGVVLSAADGASGVPLLRIEADDFTQNFDSPGTSTGQVTLRASVFRGRTLVAQKTFHKQAPAPAADAVGGASALAAASDAAITDLIVWLDTLGLK